jgi:phosphoribosylformimino-5-aminoimidazole carboxamide ribonucleotide (ProFAR) isomerase
MLIPSIDLLRGRMVPPVLGHESADTLDDVGAWMAQAKRFPALQLIDLDAAMSRGNNDALVRRIASEIVCRVGGGVRTVARAEELLAAGTRGVIVGSALFRGPGQWTAGDAAADPGIVINHDFARALAQTVGPQRIIAAIDARGGRVVIHGRKTALPIAPLAAVLQLEGYCDEFLYADMDIDSLAHGPSLEGIRTVKGATTCRVTAASGVTTREAIDALQAMGVDVVVSLTFLTEHPDLEQGRGGTR